MKKLLPVIIAVVFACYIIFSILIVNEKGTDAVCSGVAVEIKDSADRNFITRRDVIRLLRSSHLYPVDTPLRAVNTARIEHRITESGPVDRAKVYKTPSGIPFSESSSTVRVITSMNRDIQWLSAPGMRPICQWLAEKSKKPLP